MNNASGQWQQTRTDVPPSIKKQKAQDSAGVDYTLKMEHNMRTDIIKPFQGSYGDSMQDTAIEMMDAIFESISVTMCRPHKDAANEVPKNMKECKITLSSNPGGNCEEAVTQEH